MADIPRISEYVPGHVPAQQDKGLLAWLRREFKRIASGFSAINQTRVRAVFGSMGGYEDDPFPDIGLAYQDIDNYLEVMLDYGVDFDNVAGYFSFSVPGWFAVTFAGSLEHNESNQGRETFIRVYNVDDAVAGNAIKIGVARNQPATNISMPSIVQIEKQQVGKDIVFQIGGGDSFTTCNWDFKYVQIASVGP